MTPKLGYTVRQYCEAIGAKNTSRIYSAIDRGEIPTFIPPGMKRGKRIPVEWIEEQINKQIAGPVPRQLASPTHRLGNGVALASGDSSSNGDRQ